MDSSGKMLIEKVAFSGLPEGLVHPGIKPTS
jgi:hypothetical protein